MNKDTLLPQVLHATFLRPFKLQSDYSRTHSAEIGALASMGLISTAEGPGKYGRKWRVTGLGLDTLKSLKMI